MNTSDCTVLPILFRDFLQPEDLHAILRLVPTLKFETGRQQSGYEKVSLLRNVAAEPWVLRCASIHPNHGYDAWLLRYPTGSCVPPHKDTLEDPLIEHHRINVLVAQSVGGEAYVENKPVALQPGDGYYFRPDIQKHWVTPITKGERVVLSVGFALDTTRRGI